MPLRCCHPGPSSYCRLCLLHATPWHGVRCSAPGTCAVAPEALGTVRAAVRTAGGRLVVRRGDAPSAGTLDDAVALELMRSVKLQLDPSRTLSPGRQVGGI